MTSGLIKPKPEPSYPPLQASFSDGSPDVPNVSGDGADEDEAEDGFDTDGSEDDPLMPRADDGKPHRRRIGDMPMWKFISITAGILVLGFIIAATVDELEVGECHSDAMSVGLINGIMMSDLNQCLASLGLPVRRSSPSSSLVSSTSSCSAKSRD